MARSRAERGKPPFLPESVTAFLKRRAIEALGLAVALLGLALLAALGSFSTEDPSLNRATDGTIANLMGRPGAIIADLSLQAIGLAATIPALLLLAWGLHIAVKRPPRQIWLRLTLLPLALGLAAAGFSGLPAPDAWPLRAELGGYLGWMILGAGLEGLSALGLSLPVLMLGLPLLAAGLGLSVWLLGIAGSEWALAGRFLGRLIRGGGLALRGTGRALGALLSARANRQRPAPAAGRRPGRSAPVRREPRMKHDTPAAARAAEIAPPIEPRADAQAASRPAARDLQSALNLVRDDAYDLPGLDLLAPAPDTGKDETLGKESLEANARLLMSVLEDFGVKGEILRVRPGPVVTLYELEPAPGIKSSRVIGLSDDIARSMSAVSVRIAVVPGRNVIGIELPNARRETVYLSELLGSDAYERTASRLTLALGKDIGGAPVIADLARMPHLLIAGTTGSGKSVAINTMILSLLYRLTPDECRFIMIDPKMLELSVYDDIPHLLAPVVTEPGKAVVALRWTVKEMENRYRAMSELGVRNIAGYNQRLAEARRKGSALTRRVQTGFDPETGKPVIEEQALDLSPLPLIVIVVDEMADLMLVAGKDIEGAVQRLSQMARAAGIHIIMATQRPSVDVITGTIKANFPTRISFQVTSRIDSRTILGEQGAEQLLGQGDMLYMAGGGRIMRVHGPFVSDQEVERVVEAIKAQGEPDYLDAVTEDDSAGFDGGGGDSGDTLYDQAVALVLRERRASTSFIQRHLQIGYNRAARIMDQMEAEGVVSPANHAGKREVLPGGG